MAKKPTRKKERKDTQVAVRMTTSLRGKLQEMADAEQRSLGSMINKLLAERVAGK